MTNEILPARFRGGVGSADLVAFVEIHLSEEGSFGSITKELRTEYPGCGIREAIEAVMWACEKLSEREHYEDAARCIRDFCMSTRRPVPEWVNTHLRKTSLARTRL